MLDLPEKIIVFDTEYTAWEGSLQREWSGPNEYREVVQIGAVFVETEEFVELNSFNVFVRPKKNPTLSEYFVTLTGITQEIIHKQAIDFPLALRRLYEWSNSYDIYSFDKDDADVLRENCRLSGIDFPFEDSRFFDIREIFLKAGIPVEQYSSGSIVEAFGKAITRRPHNALNDARTIVDGLRELSKRNV